MRSTTRDEREEINYGVEGSTIRGAEMRVMR